MTKLPPLPNRDDDAHKGTFGHLLIIAGSERMSGAARLCGLAALRGGSGLVTIATPRAAWPIVAAENPAWMTIPLDEADGFCSANALPVLRSACEGKSALALGPGLGQTTDVQQLVQRIYHDCQVPLVLDADGLNAFADDSTLLQSPPHAPARILTPHPGEFAKLLKLPTSAVQQDREALAQDFARHHGVILVLKGAATVITDGERTVVNPTGNSGLARGGTGDILTGLIGSLLAQDLPPFNAAHLATYWHGLAGDIAAEQFTKQAMSVIELLDSLPAAWQQMG